MKALIFDIDGVLLDHEDQNGHKWLDKIENDLMISKDLIEQIHKDSRQWKLLSLGQYQVEKYFDEFIEKNNISRISSKQLLHYFIKNDTFSRDYMFEEIKNLKEKHYQLYIATHQVPEKGQRLWFIENFNKYFIEMFTSYDIGYLKTDVEFFDKISEKIQIDKKDTILIDDKKSNVDTAIKAGWQGYLYESFDKIKVDLFDKL